jgi:undecaprenyl diphosphate synthase
MQNKLPQHIAIIMDGNGRWATKNKVLKLQGHKKGAEVARNITTQCLELKIPYLTLYAFSHENWQRPIGEINDIMGLLRFYFNNEIQQLHQHNIKINFIGNISQLPFDIQQEIGKIERLTVSNHALTLNIALSYGGRQEIVDAIKRISAECVNKKLATKDIDESLFADYLYTKSIPDPDLLIRTSGEQRISNFLLWQLAYTELYFTDILWPDFTIEHLTQAITEFQLRERRYGKRHETQQKT